MNQKTVSAFGCWDSAFSAEKVCSESEDIGFLQASDGGVFYINSIPGNKDQLAVWRLSKDGSRTRVSAEGFNVRSRVHEYGGRSYLVHDDSLYFTNLKDQVVYRQRLSSPGLEPSDSSSGQFDPIPITSTDSQQIEKLRYGDFLMDPGCNRLICVREDHRNVDPQEFDASKVINTLVAIDLNQSMQEEVLFGGSDFVSSPRISPDGKTLAWQTWSHPNMPWDNTEIRIADIESDGKLSNFRQVAQATKGSLLQPQFDQQGQLYFVADWSDWWNLYRVTTDELSRQQASCEAEPVYPLEAEFAPPPWVFGQLNYVLLDSSGMEGKDAAIVVSYTRKGQWELGLIKLAEDQQPELVKLEGDYGQLENLVSHDGARLYFAAATSTAVNNIYSLDLSLGNSHHISRHSPKQAPSYADEDLSRAEIICFETGENQLAYGNFYAPSNASFVGPQGCLPPLLVGVHGGPTSAAKTSLNLKVQYWTNRGFAVVDVNHRGSTGFGRKFRHSLYPNWGLFDLEDIIAAVRYLVDEKRVDGRKVAIHGGSAGGYSVMAALAHCDLFAAGTSYYGVSDLEVLAQGTHKFESRYLDQLIGPYPEARQVYRDRSPIYNIDSINAPLLLLQGLDDKVVPPDQAEGIRQKLLDRGVDVGYITFEGEGHGFRQLKNQVRALEAELDFYRENLGMSS